MKRMLVLVALIGVLGCGGDGAGAPDAAPDAAVGPVGDPDAGVVDAGDAAPTDAGVDGGVDAGPERAPPDVVISFPAATSAVDGDALVITGTAQDASGIAEVRVDGVVAGTGDAPGTWRATVSTVPGRNTVVVEADDTLGNRAATELLFDRNTPLLGPRGGEIRDGFAYVLDFTRLVRIELDTGIATEIASLEPFLRVLSPTETRVDVRHLALDLARDRVFVANPSRADGAGPGVWVYSFTSGEWSAFSDATTGGGPDFMAPSELMLDAARNRLVVHDGNARALYAVSLDDGVRSVLATDSVYNSTCDLEMDVGVDRILVTCQRVRFATLVATVDPVTGVHSIVSQAGTVGGGTLLPTAPTSVGRAVPGGPLWLWADLTGLLQIDEATGDRNLVASPSVIGSSRFGDLEFSAGRPVLIGREGVRWNDGDTTSIWSESYPAALNGFDWSDFAAAGRDTWLFGEDGARWVSDATVVGGWDAEPGVEVEVLAVDGASAILAYVSPTSGALRLERLDLETGDRVELPAPLELAPGAPYAMAYDRTGDRVFLVLDGDTEPVLAEVALATGTSRLLPSSALVMVNPTGMAFDRRNDRLLVADESYTHLIAVSLADGERTVFSSTADPGPPLSFVGDVSVDDEGRVWALSDALYLVGDDGGRVATGLDADQIRAGREVMIRSRGAVFQVEPDSGNLALRAGDATSDR